jgi:hypothetical protein
VAALSLLGEEGASTEILGLVSPSGGSENGPWSSFDDSPRLVGGVVTVSTVSGDLLPSVVDDPLASGLEAISTILSPEPPTLTTCARACVTVLALLRKVDPTLKLLAALVGRRCLELLNFSKSMLGIGGVLGALEPDLTLTIVGLARIPVWAGVRTCCLPPPKMVDATLERGGANEVRSENSEMPEYVESRKLPGTKK